MRIGDIMKNYTYALCALALVTASTSVIAQTMPSAIPYGQTAALPPGAASAPQVDPNAPYWVQLEGTMATAV
jgi:hypothetical protein